jgi:hypothetical protein
MLPYLEMEMLTYERQADIQAAFEQRQLEQSLAPRQPHPLLAWIGQQLIALGCQLQGERRSQGAPHVQELLPVQPS